jgi:hypothetical protein
MRLVETDMEKLKKEYETHRARTRAVMAELATRKDAAR